MRIQGVFDTATSLDHRHRYADQARLPDRHSRSSGPAGATWLEAADIFRHTM
jgi:hypothetical protein